MRTFYITEEQQNAIKSALLSDEASARILINEENRGQKKACEDAIRSYCHPHFRQYLDVPLRELPPQLQQGLNPSGEGRLFNAVANNQNGVNKFIDFLRLNLYSQFSIGRNSNLVNYIPGISRIACRDCGFYTFDPSQMKGGQIIKLGRFLRLLDKKSDFLLDGGEIDKDLNGLSYTDLMRLFDKKLKAYAKNMTNSLSAESQTITTTSDYKIFPIPDAITNGYGGTMIVPTQEGRNMLNKLGQYTDWCICGNQFANDEYAQYLSSGGKFYICAKNGFEHIEKKQGENCPLDEYGLSLIAVVVGPDGLPDNVTTRWNHEFGGENHDGLWEAIQLQRLLQVNFREVFKPRSKEELASMHLNEEKTPSAQKQVNGKVNSQVLFNAACGEMMESIDGDNIWYRGYNSDYSNFGVRDGQGIWITDELSYAYHYASEYDNGKIAVFELDKSKLNYLSEGGMYDEDLDPYVSNHSQCNIVREMGYNSWLCNYIEDDADGFCILDPSLLKHVGTITLQDAENMLRHDNGELLQENSNDKKINEYIKVKFGLTNFQDIRNKVMEIYRHVPYARIDGSKYIMGVARLMFEDNISPSEYPTLNKILYNVNKLWWYSIGRLKADGNLNGMSLDELKKIYLSDEDNIPIFNTIEKTRSACNGYTVVHVESYEEMNSLCDGEWCISYDKGFWNDYVNTDGLCVYYVENDEMLNRWDEIYHANPRKWDEIFDEMAEGSDDMGTYGSGKAPYDEYGLSRFVVLVGPHSMACYSRYNIPNGFDGDFMSKQNLSTLLGFPFHELFPYIPPKGFDKEGSEIKEGAEPESDKYSIGFENNSSMEYGHVNENAENELDAYHGTVHDFDKFDTSFMGTGEGAQAYGWGVYVTSNKQTGEHYAESIGNANDRFSPKAIWETFAKMLLLVKRAKEAQNPRCGEMVEGLYDSFFNVFPQYYVQNIDIVNEIQKLLNNYKIYSYPEKNVNLTDEEIASNVDILYNKAREESKKLEKSNKILYSVSIPDDNGMNYIIWNESKDKWLGDLFECGIEIFNRYYKNAQYSDRDIESAIESYLGSSNMCGEVYKAIKEMLQEYHIDERSGERTDKLLSLALKDRGYSGIKVPIDLRRGGQYEGWNYVVFDANEVNINSKNRLNESATKDYNFKKDFLPIAKFMKKEGLNVYPFPNVKLNWEEQDGLFIKTGYYEPETKTIVIFCSDRHPKDILRTFAHEMIHHSQNLDGKDLNFNTTEVKDDGKLEEIEGEAYLKGNIYFRKWTEYERSKSSLNENIGFESVEAQAPDDENREILDFGININVDEKDWFDLIFKGEKTIVTCGERNYKQWKQHIGEMIGLVQTTRHPSKETPTSTLLGYARLVGVKKYTDYNFVDDYANHCIPQNSNDATDRCGLVLNDVHELNNGMKVEKETKSVRPLNYPNNITEDTNPEDIDLSSFNIKGELNPKFWKDEKLDSRIRMRLLDIADDFIEFLGVDWVKPKDIIMTGSLANYNWNKKYSDIDLHILMDFSKVDKRRDFVENYFYSQKKLWNDEHKDLKIFGFPIEVFVQDINEKHSSTGVYSLDKNKWITEPEREKLSTTKVNKSYIKTKVAEYVDKIDDLLTIYNKANTDDYKIRKISERADKLFDAIKRERSRGLEKSNNEISNGNVIFKCLRRMGYIEKIAKLKSESYDKLNSIS